MDAEGIQQIASLITSGGSALTIFAVYVAWKAGQTAKEAVTALKEMRDAILKSSGQVEQITKLATAIDDRTDHIETVLKENGNKLDRLLPRAA